MSFAFLFWGCAAASGSSLSRDSKRSAGSLEPATTALPGKAWRYDLKPFKAEDAFRLNERSTKKNVPNQGEHPPTPTHTHKRHVFCTGAQLETISGFSPVTERGYTLLANATSSRDCGPARLSLRTCLTPVPPPPPRPRWARGPPLRGLAWRIFVCDIITWAPFWLQVGSSVCTAPG